MEHDEKIALLKCCAPLANAPEETLSALADAFDVTACDTGMVMIRQGETSQVLYIVAHGHFQVFIANKEGADERISMLERGAIFGEIGVVSGIPATATVQSLTKGELLQMSAPKFHSIMNGSPQLAEAMLRSMANYLSK